HMDYIVNAELIADFIGRKVWFKDRPKETGPLDYHVSDQPRTTVACLSTPHGHETTILAGAVADIPILANGVKGAFELEKGCELLSPHAGLNITPGVQTYKRGRPCVRVGNN